MPPIFPPKFGPANPCLRFSAPTADLAWHDPEIARFVERAMAAHLQPSVFEVRGRMFPFFAPESNWDAPMLLHWLGDGYDDVIDELAHVQLGFQDHISTDLLRRRQVLTWKTETHAFCASAVALSGSLKPDSELLSVFISPARFVSNVSSVDVDMLIQLSVMAQHSGRAYRPQDWHTDEEMFSALVASVLRGNEPKVDEDGRRIVLLKKRALPKDWLP